MIANTRIGMRQIRWTDRKSVGCLQTCDEQNDNGERLLMHALITKSPFSIRSMLHMLVVYRTRFKFRLQERPSAGFFLFFHTSTFCKAVVTGIVPSPPLFFPSMFIAHRVQRSHCSSSFHRVLLLTHAGTISASTLVQERKCP